MGRGNTPHPFAAVVELADTRDLKSLGSDTVPVRSRSAAPNTLDSPLWVEGVSCYRLLLLSDLYHVSTVG